MKKLASALLLCTAAPFISPAFASLIINEVDYDQASTDNAEFIELFNQATSSINLSSYSVNLINGNNGGDSIYNSIVLPSINLAAGDYFVICGNSLYVINCDLEASKNSNLIQNGSPDAIALLLNNTLID
ncbi:MAG TPA: lamin tail domain-containing protein, partial [Oceanospirillales bacterium]|nr:lamin tail domain-containing protein [Oceanospirillales bacterium]